MLAELPRSTWSHCGSEKALDQRVPVLPSTAADAGKVAFSVEEAVAVFPWDSRVAACALPTLLAVNMMVRASAAISAPTIRRRYRRPLLSRATSGLNDMSASFGGTSGDSGTFTGT